MRALLAAATVGLLSVPAVSAQTTFGLKAGLNVANVSLEEENDDQEPRLGLVAGAFADVPLTPSLTFHPEVLYTQKGFKESEEFNEGGIEGSFSATYQLDYIEVPLLLSYRIPAGPNGLVFGIEAGPTLAYKLNANIDFSCSGDAEFESFCDTIDEDGDDTFDESTTDFDIGAALGLTVGAGPFGVGARFTQGITSIIDSEEGVDDDETARNQVFSLTAMYRFGM